MAQQQVTTVLTYDGKYERVKFNGFKEYRQTIDGYITGFNYTRYRAIRRKNRITICGNLIRCGYQD